MRENNEEILDIENIDDWVKLASADPDAFEIQRQRAIEAHISKAPEAQQRRLRGLQWQIDMVRDRSATPLASCIAISNMMWSSVERFVRLDDEYASLRAADDTTDGRATDKVINFYNGKKAGK